MPPRATLTLAFETNGGPVDLTQLGDFLLLFRGAYVASIRPLSRLDVDAVTRNPEDALTLVQRRLRRLRVRQLDQLFTSELGEDALTATTISRDNPLKITVSGLAAALAAAVILSGGRFGGFGIEVELPPLGVGIESLREALSPPHPTRLAYGVRTTWVRLDDAELRELLKYDPRTRHRGGFQKFLIGLQFRIDRRTRLLELTESDVEMIYRYGRQLGRGGWQSSIHKIFNRHFNLTPHG